MHSDKIKEYVNEVCQQIRWKKAQERVREEMENHITDARDGYIAQGLEEQAAVQRAIKDTGDAVQIGTEFDRVHRPRAQWGLLACVAGFLVFGMYLGYVLGGAGSDWRFIWAAVSSNGQLLWAAFGLAVMLAAYFADFTILGKYPWRVCIGVALVVFVVFVLRSGGHIFSVAHRIPFTAQVLPLIFPVVFAPIIFSYRNRGYKGILACLAAFGILGIVAFMAPAPSGAWHFVIIASVLLVTAILRGWFGAINKGLGIILAFVPHVVVFGIMMAIDGQWIIARIRVTFDPFIDPLGRGFLAAQARGLLSGAAFVGEGVLPPRFPQEWLFSPSFYAYRPLTTVISRFGWLAVIVILAAVAAFIVATSAKCAKQRSGLGFFVSLAVIVTFSVQAVMYTLFNLGITIPMISLPFISPGNFAMVVNMGLAGFMLSVFRTGDVVTDGYFPSRKRSDFISWDDGKIIIRVK